MSGQNIIDNYSYLLTRYFLNTYPMSDKMLGAGKTIIKGGDIVSFVKYLIF